MARGAAAAAVTAAGRSPRAEEGRELVLPPDLGRPPLCGRLGGGEGGGLGDMVPEDARPADEAREFPPAVVFAVLLVPLPTLPPPPPVEDGICVSVLRLSMIESADTEMSFGPA